MSKRPIPMPKNDNELENFINNATQSLEKTVQTLDGIEKIKRKPINNTITTVKKSLILKEEIDSALRIESAKTKIKQIKIMESAIAEYLRNRGYKNI